VDLDDDGEGTAHRTDERRRFRDHREERFPERDLRHADQAAGIGRAWIYPLAATPDELIDILDKVRDQFLRGADDGPATPEFGQKTLRVDPDFYRGEYLEPVRNDALSRD